ncbi:putative phage abortive infection protein [Aggregatibacter kilianii]|uniref:putative phage abortive infection protein n=1 Tax=Aggregatibacter kilianii TaxID=2025884 RepID=UPI0013A6018B|nr:putative phage abortive infection protein [Aggregatibacter kilianii]
MFKEILDFIKNNKWYVLLVMGLLGLYFYQFHGGLSSESEKWDHFGSYIGGIFSAVTLLSVLHGMQLERKRFNEQRIEFENEKKEQEEWRKKEDFERTFFMMLEQHNNKINFLFDNKINRDNMELSVVDYLYQELINYPKLEEDYCIRERLEFGDLKGIYEYLDSYFLSLYKVLDFLGVNSDFNVSNKYSDILVSYIPSKLLVILSYHLYERRNSSLSHINYVNEFSLFKNVDLFILETVFISKVSLLDKEEVLKLIELIKFNQLKVLDIRLDTLERYCGEHFYFDKLKEFIDSRRNNSPILISDKDIFDDNYFLNIFFCMLVTFSPNAFKGNDDYKVIVNVYQKYLAYLKNTLNIEWKKQ